MEVDGETDTPDFQLTHFGSPLPLHSKFRAKVDGTNGDTQLESVDATLGHSHFWAQGQVVRVIPTADEKGGPLGAGHNIVLTVKVDRGRMEDFLRLTSRSGILALNGNIELEGVGLDIPLWGWCQCMSATKAVGQICYRRCAVYEREDSGTSLEI